MRKVFFCLLLISGCAYGTKLEDVKILDITPGQSNFKLKLKTKNSPENSYFFVDIVKSDPDSFEKLVHVINKIDQRDDYKLNLNILNFSASPSGSYYRSEGIHFFGIADRESRGASSINKKKIKK